jgi:hypothetical protein
MNKMRIGDFQKSPVLLDATSARANGYEKLSLGDRRPVAPKEGGLTVSRPYLIDATQSP